MMQDLIEYIDSIEDKLRMVLHALKQERGRNSVLNEEKLALFEEKVQLEERISIIVKQREEETTKRKHPVQNEVEVKELKEELNQYISEIDHCITLLKNG